LAAFVGVGMAFAPEAVHCRELQSVYKDMAKRLEQHFGGRPYHLVNRRPVRPKKHDAAQVTSRKIDGDHSSA
jgi:hypothetical protein